MVGINYTEADERDYTVYAVKFQMHGRGCEIAHPFIEEAARDAFVSLLEENDMVGNVRTFAFQDKQYVENREREPGAGDAEVHRA
jgi:hypothetical protein